MTYELSVEDEDRKTSLAFLLLNGLYPMNDAMSNNQNLSTKSLRYINEFLFNVVNQFTIDEFKEFTNFREVMREALAYADPLKLDRLERYVELNFKQNIPIKKKWQQGGFVNLRLTSDFYESDIAARVFRKVFKTKKCAVVAVKCDDHAAQIEKSAVTEAELGNNGKDIELIDLTEGHSDSNESIYPPNRRKWMTSGSRTRRNAACGNPPIVSSENQSIQSTKPKIGPKSRVRRDASSDTSSDASSITSSNYQLSKYVSEPTKTASKNAEVQPLKPKIEPKSHMKRDLKNQLSKDLPESSQTSLRIADVQLCEPKTGPKSSVQRDSSSDGSPITSLKNQLSKDLMESSQTSLRNSEVKPPKRKIGPKSRVRDTSFGGDAIASTKNQALKNLREPSQLSLQINIIQSSKPKIGPKSRVKQDASSDRPPISSSNYQLLKDLSESTQIATKNDEVQPLKPKIGPKSRIKQDNSKNQLSKDLSESSQTSLKNVDVQLCESKTVPKSPVRRDSSSDGPPITSVKDQPSKNLTEPSQTSLQNAGVKPPKCKIGPKSRVRRISSDSLSIVSPDNLPSKDLLEMSQIQNADKPSNPDIRFVSQLRSDISFHCFQNDEPSTKFIALESVDRRPIVSSEQSQIQLQIADVHLPTIPSETSQNLIITSTPKIGYTSPSKHDVSSDQLQKMSSENIPLARFLELSELSEKSENELKSQMRRDPSANSGSTIFSENQTSKHLLERSHNSLRTELNTSTNSGQNDLSNSTCLSDSLPARRPIVDTGVEPSRPTIDLKSRVVQTISSDDRQNNFSENPPIACLQNRPQASSRNLDNLGKSQLMERAFPDCVLDDKSSKSLVDPLSYLMERQFKSPKRSLEPHLDANQDAIHVNLENRKQKCVMNESEEAMNDGAAKQLSVDSIAVTHESPLLSSFKQSFRDQIAFIENQFKKYLATTHSSKVSLKQFWQLSEAQLSNCTTESNSLVEVETSPSIFGSKMSLTNAPKNICDVEANLENLFGKTNRDESSSSDVQMMDISNQPIEITDNSTQDLLNILRVDRDESFDQAGFCGPFALPQYYSKRDLTSLSTSKGIDNRSIQLSQKSLENNVSVDGSGKITVTDSQIQRYNLLNYENTMFLSSQLENFDSNKSESMGSSNALQRADRFALKRPSPTINFHPSKLRILFEDQQKNVVHKLNLKILNIKSATFKPWPMDTFTLELQLRNNFDIFHLNDQQSIKRLLNVNNSEWKHIVGVLKVLNGYTYEDSNPSAFSQKSDLLHRVLNCFMQSIPFFVKSPIQFRDFMGNVLEVNQRQPFTNKCVKSSVEPSILERMIEFKKNLKNKSN